VRVVYSWLREFCDPGVPPEEAAEVLVRLGFEVAAVHRPWDGVLGVVAARVLEVRDHPRSENLVLARLDTGSGRADVVAGVRNFRAGDVVPYAPPGSTVATLPDPLEVRRLRGETSEGMICSPHELAVSAEHGGIMILPPEVRPGQDVMAWLGL
jgi:phenylalanyl-tRNA synthetase beta chain